MGCGIRVGLGDSVANQPVFHGHMAGSTGARVFNGAFLVGACAGVKLRKILQKVHQFTEEHDNENKTASLVS